MTGALTFLRLVSLARGIVDNVTAQKVIVTDDEQCLAPQSLGSSVTDPLAYIVGIREYDVPYTMRVAIDLDIRVGAWYLVTPEYGTETCNVSLVCCPLVARSPQYS